MRTTVIMLGVLLASELQVNAQQPPPNVLVIITDDQGHGDFGVHGNPVISTPHLDRLARQSVQLTNFCVSPVCAPTRASLLTGRYNYRTRVVDTYLGRALMDPDEVTLAEVLAQGGYRTGIFGKWHLGDNYPLRAIDQGFHEALVLKGGGIGQPSDLPDGSSYFDPALLHNGQVVRSKGYCSDVFTDAAMEFITKHREQPFFVYLAFNAPHDPLQVPERYAAPYQQRKLRAADFPSFGQPFAEQFDPDATAKTYGMIANIDDNVGRLLDKLDELKLAENTIVVFLTDNGPQRPRYKSGFRGQKGTVYEGGIRVPCWVRCPAKLLMKRQIDYPAAHIDLMPTLLAACGVAPPKDVKLDGLNLLPLLQGAPANLPDRTLFFQWHRGDVSELGRACAARSRQWKLVQPVPPGPNPPRFELFDLTSDPYETKDLAGAHPDIVTRLKKQLEVWFTDVSATRGYDPPRIKLGTAHENPTLLTRQDWRGPQAGWTAKSLGHWEVDVTAGTYTMRMPLGETKPQKIRLTAGAVNVEQVVPADARSVQMDNVRLPAGPARLEVVLLDGKEAVGPLYVEIERMK